MDILNLVLDPRLQDELMSQLDPTVIDQTAVEFAAPAPAVVAGRRVRIPGWLALLLRNRSRASV